jgi:hypothetical protein
MLTTKEKQESGFHLLRPRSRRVELEFESAAAACDARRSRSRRRGRREGSTVLGSEPADRPGSAAGGWQEAGARDCCCRSEAWVFGDREAAPGSCRSISGKTKLW